MALTSKARAQLRSQAHHLPVAVHVGHQGVTDALRQTLDEAFTNTELVKVQFSKNAETKARHAAQALAVAVDAEVVQAIGRTVTLFRENPELRERERRRQ